MKDIKTTVVASIGALFTLLSPIHNFMYAMITLFSLNFVVGLVAAIVNKEGWKTKKALWFFAYCAIFFVTACSAFTIGHFMGQEEQSVAVVKMMCFMAIYIFGTNIFRNWMNILTPGTAWHRFVSLVYYILSVRFIERFSIVRKWQENIEKKGE